MKSKRFRNLIGSITPPAGYVQVANEGGAKVFNSPTNIAYGANGHFAYLNNVTGNIIFSPATFGYDPLRNVVKGGFAQTQLTTADQALQPVPPVTASNPPTTTETSKPATKYLLYAGIGVAVIIAGIFLYKKLKN